MYTWYFPRGRGPLSIAELRPFGLRHNFEYVFVWLDKFSLNNFKPLRVSTFVEGMRHRNHVPLKAKYLSGSSLDLTTSFSHQRRYE
ncbi:Necrosis inducing protein NPP1 [Phytophthora megakarya]|uniref:Necrosis inducing protein NPP1 n=1 Tax=Phytophthora megakarya TaxID=4795 RepID=A0A225WD23_9STRA|nr:Necrosis inducing protein NPP1 [Phytophthora megakarya]